MTSEAASALKSLFLTLWNMLGSFTFPGTNLTGQHLLVAPLGAVVFITVLKKVLDMGAAQGISGVSFGSRSERRSNKGQED